MSDIVRHVEELAEEDRALARADLARLRDRPAFCDCTPAIFKRREALVLEGYGWIGKGRIRANDPCGCKSGRKFKHCCESNVVHLAGATWFRPGASARLKASRGTGVPSNRLA